jgi:hypothetical protein
MNKKTILGTIAFLVIAYILTALYFSPVLDGKSIPQSDVVQFEGMAKKATDYRTATGEEALWNTGMFSGMPDFMISMGYSSPVVYYPHYVLTNLFPSSLSASQLMLSMLCFFVLLRVFKVNIYLSILGAAIYALNTYNIINIEVGHNTKIWAISYSCLVLAGMRLLFEKKWFWGVPLLTLGLTLQMNAGHPQITYYLAFVCVIYGISELIFAAKAGEIGKFSKIIPIALVIVLIGVGAQAIKFWTSKEYSVYSTRGKRLLTPSEAEKDSKPAEGLSKDYAFSWSQGVTETFTLLVPYFYGGGSAEKIGKDSESYKVLSTVISPANLDNAVKNDQIKVSLYFGDQPFTAGPLYAGAIVCFLFVVGLFVLDGRDKYWVLGVALLCAMFAWGRNFSSFNYFLFDYFPGFNKFRSVSMALSMTLILMPFLGILGLDKIVKNRSAISNLDKKLLTAGGIVAGLCLLVWVSGMSGDFSKPGDEAFLNRIFGADFKNPQASQQMATALADDRASARQSDALRSFMLIAFAFGAIFTYAKGKISPVVAMVVVGFLAMGDLWAVDKRYLYNSKFEKNAIKKSIVKTPADDLILRDNDPHYRVFNLRGGFQEANTSYFHKSIGGYHAAKLRRYNDLVEMQMSREQQKLIAAIQSGNPDFSNLNILNMLNAKYFKFGNSEREVARNNSALGNAWFVQNVVDVKNADEEMAKLSTTNTATTAVVNMDEFGLKQKSFAVDSSATVKLISENARKVEYETNSNQDGLLVFSEIYYPKGWTATIDGKEAPIVRANYVLRSIQVPAGNHKVTMAFNPVSYTNGSSITAVSGWLFGCLVFGMFGFAIFKSVTNKDEEAIEDIDSLEEVQKRPSPKANEMKEVAKPKTTSKPTKSNRKKKK